MAPDAKAASRMTAVIKGAHYHIVELTRQMTTMLTSTFPPSPSQNLFEANDLSFTGTAGRITQGKRHFVVLNLDSLDHHHRVFQSLILLAANNKTSDTLDYSYTVSP